MGAKWSKAQHRKFRATMKRKRSATHSAESRALAAFEGHITQAPYPQGASAEPTVRVSQMAEFVVALVDAARKAPR
jgi:hypothetical protein